MTTTVPIAQPQTETVLAAQTQTLVVLTAYSQTQALASGASNPASQLLETTDTTPATQPRAQTLAARLDARWLQKP